MIRDQDLPIAFSQWLDQRLLRRVRGPTHRSVPKILGQFGLEFIVHTILILPDAMVFNRSE